MPSLLFGQAREAFTVQINLVQMTFPNILLSCAKIDKLALFVNCDKAIHLPAALRQLTNQLSADIIEVEVLEAVPIRRPDETFAVAQKSEVIIYINPTIAIFFN